jgi:hypothetical protein
VQRLDARRAIATLLLAACALAPSRALAQDPKDTKDTKDTTDSKDPNEAPPPPPPPDALPPPPKRPPLLVVEQRPSVDPPEGKAAPAIAAGTTGLTVQPGLELFAAYHATVTPGATGTSWYHEFEIPRAHASLTGLWGPVRASFVLEAVRSSSEGALLGVATDSVLFRAREASAGYRYKDIVAVDAGIVPTLTIPELDGTYALRATGKTGLEETGLGSPADLGGTVRVNFPKGYGFAAIGAYNGEGYNQQELNRGKNLEGAVEVHPFAGLDGGLPFALFVSYVNGSEGTGSARADRLTGGLLWQGRRVRAGATFTWAWGVGENGALDSYIVEGFLRLEPIDRLLFGAHAFSWSRDATDASNRVTEIMGAAGYRIFDPLEAYLSVTRTLAGADAEAALPGTDHWDLRVIARVVF